MFQRTEWLADRRYVNYTAHQSSHFLICAF